MNVTFFNETKIFEWTLNFWMELLKLIKQRKTEGKCKLHNWIELLNRKHIIE